jgi:curved DNA-binding protein CbpA
MRLDLSKDYFAVLGVTPQADPTVLKAAYRALAKKYHPDRQPDCDGVAKEKFQELQEAYELLSDEQRLSRYLLSRTRLQEQRAASSAREQRPSVCLQLDDRWDHLVREYPELGRHHARFCLVSQKLGRQFKLIILGTQNHACFSRIATRMERRFYRRYFTYHRDLQVLARRLAGKRKRHALRELSREINGRRLLRRRYRRSLLDRYETRYLHPLKARSDDHGSRHISLPRTTVPRARRHGVHATRTRNRIRPASWFSMGMALVTGTLLLYGANLDPSLHIAGKHAEAGVVDFR